MIKYRFISFHYKAFSFALGFNEDINCFGVEDNE